MILFKWLLNNTGALKKIINRANENKKQSQAEKNIKIVKEIVKNLRAVKGVEKTAESVTLKAQPATVMTSKQTSGGDGYGRLGDAIARGHKPPCICPDKSMYNIKTNLSYDHESPFDIEWDTVLLLCARKPLDAGVSCENKCD